MRDLPPLPAGKASAPRLCDHVWRPDQISKIADAAEAGLLLVRAPAGYGKTTLAAAAAAAAAGLGWACVWYRLDSLDADPESFLRMLTGAVRLQQPRGCGPRAQEPAGPACEALSASQLAARFVAELAPAEAKQLYVILDDYDAVEPAERFDETVAALLRLLPPGVHLVVLTRRRPAFATVKLELDGGLAEITSRELLLDRSQAATVFEQQSGAAPTPAALEKLLELTEGWAAGVVLAAKAARSWDPEGLEEALEELTLGGGVSAYLRAEVYERQPGEVREFLRRTCCLEPVTAPLAEAVFGATDAGRRLEHLRENEVFALPEPGGGIRYHPLFRRFLQRQVVHEEGAGAYRELQRSSADALVACDLVAPAVDLYLELGEPQPTLALLQRHGTGLLDECSDALLQRWVDALRTASATDSSWATLVEGRRLFRRGYLASAREQLESAHAALSDDSAGRYMAHRELARHCYLTGSDEEAVAHARKALEAAADRHQEAESLVALAQTLSATCRWQALDQALAAFGALIDAPPKLAAEIAYLEVQRTYMTGDVCGALAAAERALPLARRHTTKEEVGSLLNGIASLNFFLGRYERASQQLAEARKECAARHLTKATAEIQLTEAALLAQEDKPDAALSVLDELVGGRYARDNAALLFEVEALRGTTLRRAGRLEDAEQAYERAVRIVDSGGPPYDRLSARLDLAFTLHLCGADPQAASQIQHLMDEAARMQFLFQYAKARLYLGVMSAGSDSLPARDLGSPCEELLRLGHLDFIGQELAAHPQAAHSLAAADIDEGPLLDVLATIACQARGQEVLASLAQVSDRAGLLVVEAVRQRMPAEGRRWMLAELRRHRSRRVRDRARHMLLAGDGGRLFPELTPREEEILALLAEGCTNRQVAEQLSLTLATVKTHVHRILTRIEASGRLAAAVAYKQRATDYPGRRDEHIPE